MTNFAFLCDRGGCTVVEVQPQTKKRCPFEYARLVQRYGSKEAMYIIKAPCTSKPLKNGWCAVHQYCQEILDIGEKLGYPRFQVNESLFIGEGYANWYGSALVFGPKRLLEMQQRRI